MSAGFTKAVFSDVPRVAASPAPGLLELLDDCGEM